MEPSKQRHLQDLPRLGSVQTHPFGLHRVLGCLLACLARQESQGGRRGRAHLYACRRVSTACTQPTDPNRAPDGALRGVP